jgi:DnaA family protein
MKQLPLSMRLRERAVFDSFVAGDNAVPLEQLRSAVSAMHGVFWVTGPSGAGKSHLLQASCALAGAAGGTAAYLPLASLLPLGPDALEGWQAARLVALDDLGLVAGEPDWDRSLFRLYRELEEREGMLLVADVSPPRLLRFALADLASRFAAATLLPLRALDDAGQREALRLQAQARGLELPEETALYLQRHFRRDMATLNDLLETLDEAALQAQRRLTLPFIRQVLARRGSRAAD